MNNYTVLLLRPCDIASDFGTDTYLAHVTALNAQEAMAKGRRDAFESDSDGSDEEDDPINPDDYHVLFCTMGHLQDLSVG